MRYKFFGEPNLLIKTRKKVPYEGTIDFKPLFRFDAKGEYITEDADLIERLKGRFDHIEVLEAEEPLPFEEEEEPKEEAKFKCKKCEFETANKGELMAHYRKHK